MIKIRKTFFAIGQGCFYCERLYYGNQTKTIVYDCGSFNTERLNKEINQSGLSTIDYLVISHFHKDHINGIKALQKISEIKNVIIPKIDAIDVAFYLESKNTVPEALLNPSEFWGGSRVYTIQAEGGQQELASPENLPLNITHVSSFPIAQFERKLIWILKFYVDKRVFLKDNLTDNQKQIINATLSIDDYSQNRKELRTAYRALSKKDINLTSMSMLSAPADLPIIDRYYYPISVLNGDILLNSEERIFAFRKHFSDYLNCFIDFHVPHHGSHENLLRPINEFRTNKAFILSGYESPYGHPSGVILRKLRDSKISFKVLTEYEQNYDKFYDYYYG